MKNQFSFCFVTESKDTEVIQKVEDFLIHAFPDIGNKIKVNKKPYDDFYRRG